MLKVNVEGNTTTPTDFVRLSLFKFEYILF